MTVSEDTETPLWAAGSRHARPRPVPAKCALCPAPPASAFGLCIRCLASAAAEHALVAPPAKGRLSDIQARDLCRRCGRSGHNAGECDA